MSNKLNKMKKISIILAFLFISNFYAQKSKCIAKTWLLTTIHTQNKKVKPYAVVQFKPNGKMAIRNYEIANWKIDGNKLIIDSNVKKSLSGVAQILKINKKQLIYSKGNDTFYYIAYNPKQVKDDPVYNKNLGVWQMNGNQLKIIEFMPDGKLSYFIDFGNGTMTSIGNWIYIPDQKKIILQGDLSGFEGIYTIQKINNEIAEWEKDKIHYQWEKKSQIDNPPHLSFAYEEVENNEGETHDLPWSQEALSGYLKGIKKVEYQLKIYEPDVHTFREKNIVSEIEVNEEKDQITFTNFEIKDEEKFIINKEIKGYLQNAYNAFFPQKDIGPFQIKNNFEKIKINGKEYICTVVEGFDGDTKIKYWMINDKPGIYAKVMIENETFPSLMIYELIQELQKN
jgi:hypothetical protein